MNRTFLGLAFLNYNWENNNKDIIDSYVPLACSCIVSKKCTQINRDDLQLEFKQIYGLDNITLGAVESILKRMVKDGLLIKEAGIYTIVKEKVYALHQKTEKKEIETDYNKTIDDIIKYSKEKFNIEYDKKNIEDGLLAFLAEFDVDLILDKEGIENNFSKIKESKKLKYIISKYIISIKELNKKEFKNIIAISQGHAIASLITYKDVENYTGKLNDVEIYIDAPIIFNLLGINGESNLALANELISELKKNGAKLKIFEINYEEVISTIGDAIERLKTGSYDLYKCSRVLRTAVRESYTPTLLKIKLNQVEDLLNKHDIEKLSSPIIESHKYEIDQNRLSEIIENIYTNNGIKHLPFYKKSQIERDVEVISYIYRIRKNNYISNLKSSKAILLTSNEAIAFASKHNEVSTNKVKPTIPPCLTDVFLATILWSNYPSKNKNLNIKRLISECHANIELDNKLLQRFYEDIEKMHKEQRITDEQFYLINSSNLSYKLLEKLTLNDIDEYTDKTPAEVVQETINALKHGEEVIDGNIKRISNRIGSIAFWLILIILIILTLCTRLIAPSLSTTIYGKFSWIISLLLGCFGLFRWANKVPPRERVISYFGNLIYKAIMKFLKKEE